MNLPCARDGPRALSLCCTNQAGPSNLIVALNKREKYGRRRDVSGKYRADIDFLKLECLSIFSRYNPKKMKWEECAIPTVPRDFLGRYGLILGLSSDSTYLIMLKANPGKASAVIYFLLLYPEVAIHRNHITVHEYTASTKLHMYFHPFNRFISTFVYNESHFQTAFKTGRSESSIFHVHTLFPEHSVCLSLTSSATIVCRKVQKCKAVLKKHYLRIHANGFILNTGVSLIMMLFSDSVPAKLKYKQRVWRVVLQQKHRFDNDQPSSVTCDLGEEISVEPSIRHESESIVMSYKLIDCEKKEYLDSNFPCGLRKPFFVSRHVVCIESLIDRFITVHLRTSSYFKGATYLGSRDYEADVHHVDNEGVCYLVVMCVSELQVPSEDGESTRNCFFLFQIQILWSVFYGWKVGGKCRLIKELRHEVAFNPSFWYPYSCFPVDKDDYAYNIPNLKKDMGENKCRLVSRNDSLEVIVDLDKL